ncbi:MAG: amino acid permease, partial [Isosphaeraceae bacterium]
MIDPTSASETPAQEHALSRRLGLSAATAVVVAEVIGVGIFLTAAGMVKSLGSPFWLLLVWLTTGLAATGGALCLGALAARWPQAGGPYVYLKEAYGPRLGFLFGWLSMLVTDPGITAALGVG